MRAAPVTIACAVFAAAVPLASVVVVTSAAHPTLAALLPPPVAAACAGFFFLLVVGIAIREIATREPIGPVFRAALVFAGCAFAGSFFGFEPLTGLIAAIAFGGIAFASNAIERVARAGAWEPVVAAFLASGVACCLSALLPVLLRRPAGLYAFAHGRALGIFENPNELAEFTLAVIAVGVATIISGAGRPRPGLRALAWTSLVFAALTLFATGSRSGELALAIGAVVLIAGLRPRRGIAAIVFVIALAGLAAGVALDRRHNPGETASRLEAWEAGVRTVALAPLTGVGIGAYHRLYPFVRGRDAPGSDDPIAYDPHNFYLSVAAETGLMGLGALGFMIFRIVGEFRAVLGPAAPPARRFALALGAGLVADGCHLMFNGFALSIALWAVLVALALGVARSGYGRAI